MTASFDFKKDFESITEGTIYVSASGIIRDEIPDNTYFDRDGMQIDCGEEGQIEFLSVDVTEYDDELKEIDLPDGKKTALFNEVYSDVCEYARSNASWS